MTNWPRTEIYQILARFVTVESRLDAMLRDGMLMESDGIYRLTPKGRTWANTFSSWRRRLCALPAGG